jgi:hypothetical protein
MPPGLDGPRVDTGHGGEHAERDESDHDEKRCHVLTVPEHDYQDKWR